MALTASQQSEVFAIVTQHILKETPDILAKSSYIYKYLVENKKFVSGGDYIQAPIVAYDLQSQGMIDGRFGTISNNQNQQLTHARFDWKFFYHNVSLTLSDMVKTFDSEDAIMSLAKAKKDASVDSIVRFLNLQFLGSAATNSLNFNGLTDVFAASPTAYGGLSPADVPNWLPFIDSTSTVANYATFSNVIDNLLVRSKAAPSGGVVDVAISNQRVYSAYKQTLQVQQRFQGIEELNSGFKGIMIDGVFFYPDPDVQGTAATSDNIVYFLNKKGLQLCYKYWFDAASPLNQTALQIPNQPVQASIGYFAGNIVGNNRYTQGICTTINA